MALTYKSSPVSRKQAASICAEYSPTYLYYRLSTGRSVYAINIRRAKEIKSISAPISLLHTKSNDADVDSAAHFGATIYDSQCRTLRPSSALYRCCQRPQFRRRKQQRCLPFNLWCKFWYAIRARQYHQGLHW